MTGRLIGLVGTSSVGKSSVAAQLQPLLPDPYLVVGVDLFFTMFPHHWADHPRGPGPGFWYDDSVDPGGSPRARIRYGQAGARLLAGMRAAVRAMLDCGNDIILDEMPIDETILPAWRRELSGYDQFWIRLNAPLEVVEAREAGRTRGQHLGNARGHLGIVDDALCDLQVETAGRTPEELATMIKASIGPPAVVTEPQNLPLDVAFRSN